MTMLQKINEAKVRIEEMNVEPEVILCGELALRKLKIELSEVHFSYGNSPKNWKQMIGSYLYGLLIQYNPCYGEYFEVLGNPEKHRKICDELYGDMA